MSKLEDLSDVVKFYPGGPIHLVLYRLAEDEFDCKIV